MASGTAHFLRGDAFVSSREEVNRQNRLAIRYFAIAGIPVSLVNIAAQLVIKGTPALAMQSAWILAYFAVLVLVDRLLSSRELRHATLLVYVLEAPVLLGGIMLGTVWDPTHQAMTFLMYMVIAPVFILDRPSRVMGITLGWNLLFALFCLLYKDPATFRPDMLHALEFFLSSMAVSYVVLRLRLEVLRSLERTTYHLEHDQLTNARNRRSLERHADDFLGRHLLVMLGDIDHFTLLNDFYGQQIADELLRTLSASIMDSFGKDATFRYGGDEILGIAVNGTEEQALAHMAACRKQLEGTRSMTMYSRVTCSFGYVTGTPQTVHELHEMIQLADIYAHQATRKGENQTIGGPFDHAALRAGIVESNIATHARAYEINQLTGLPSMAYFITRAEELLMHVADFERKPVVGFFNLIHFHDYNDAYGYSKGDELIRNLADLLRQSLPKRHITYISGSQFGVLCYEDEIEPTMKRVNEALDSYGTGANIQIKAGFVEYRRGDSVISLLDKARQAYESIVDQKSMSYCMYDPRLDEELRFRHYLITHLDEALEKGWVKVYYQPIVHAGSGEICNLEALSRWDDPTYGFLPPAKFIGVLERERLIYKLSLYVIRQILQDFAQLEIKGIPLVPVSVNLSRTDFFECDMVSEVTALVDASGYSHHMLNIEITESAFAEDQGLLKTEVDRFRANGFAVWMDDFGSEYSTLNLLEELNFDLIKVDMRFMRNLTSKGRNAIILSDILSMCRRLGITTLVEGVETEEQYAILRDLGSDKLQGYLFSRPCELTELFG